MRIARRIGRVEAATSERRRLMRTARAIAARYGVTVDSVLDEARRLRDEAWSQNVAPEVVVARECGVSISVVRAEVARLLAEAEGTIS